VQLGIGMESLHRFERANEVRSILAQRNVLQGGDEGTSSSNCPDVIRTIRDENWEPVLSVFLLVCLLLFALVIWQIAIVAATPQVPRSLTTQ
jgi:hypothetical protein